MAWPGGTGPPPATAPAAVALKAPLVIIPARPVSFAWSCIWYCAPSMDVATSAVPSGRPARVMLYCAFRVAAPTDPSAAISAAGPASGARRFTSRIRRSPLLDARCPARIGRNRDAALLNRRRYEPDILDETARRPL